MISAIRATRAIIVVLATSLTGTVFIGGCQEAPPPRPAPPPPTKAAPPAPKPAPLPVIRPTLSAGERRAIEEAKQRVAKTREAQTARALKPDQRQPDTMNIMTKTTKEDQRAAADDPALKLGEKGLLKPQPPIEATEIAIADDLDHDAREAASGDTLPDVQDAKSPSSDSAPSNKEPKGRILGPGVTVYGGGDQELIELTVATGVEGRRPIGASAHFEQAPERLFCFTSVRNDQEDAKLTHVWRRGTRVVSRVELSVGRSPSWRTWSRQRTRADWTGAWSCEVLDAKSKRLGIAEFTVGNTP